MRYPYTVIAISLAFDLTLAATSALAQDDFMSATKGQREELRDLLEEKYDDLNVNVVSDGFKVALVYDAGPFTGSWYHINYDHFYEAFPRDAWPSDYRRRNLLDEFTTEEITGGALRTAPLLTGEMLRVRSMDVEFPGNDEAWNMRVDLNVVALGGNRPVVREQTPGGLNPEVPYGLHMRFVFPSFGPDIEWMFNKVVSTIDRYFLPNEEYVARKAAYEAQAEARRNVELAPGMSEEEVTALLGAPSRRVAFGAHVTLSYEGMTLIFQDGALAEMSTD